MQSHSSRLKQKNIHSRNIKIFNKQKFTADIKNVNFSLETDDPNENYSALSSTFSLIMEKHSPLKNKTLRKNYASFITEDLRNAIYTSSRLKNKFVKNTSEINKKLYKKTV